MGLNAKESEDRILKVYDCRDFDKMYWEGTDETDEDNRIMPYENSNYDEEVEEVMHEIETYILSKSPENSELVY